MKSEFAKGCDFVESEVRNYIESHKETITEHIPYQDGSSYESTREMIDVEDFIKFLDNM